jgi:hypothetical protein
LRIGGLHHSDDHVEDPADVLEQPLHRPARTRRDRRARCKGYRDRPQQAGLNGDP